MSLRAPCAGCGSPVPISTARAVVQGQTVALYCPPCAASSTAGSPVAATPPAPARRDDTGAGAAGARLRRSQQRVPVRLLAVGGVLVGAFVVAPLLSSYLPTTRDAFGGAPGGVDRAATEAGKPAPAARPAQPIPGPFIDSDGDGDSDDAGARAPAPALVETVPAEEPPSAALPLTVDNGEPVEITWYHPLAAPRRLPDKADRRFGAARDGGRPECGLGHCGVDLAHHAGLVVHAARSGRVVRIVTDAERKGGRYVKLEHEGGYFTYYFHLDRIHPSMVVGIEVAAGDPIGTTGHSGIKHSGPHLHFAITRLRPDGSEEYLDPEPVLRRAILLDHPAPFPPVPRRIAATEQPSPPATADALPAGDDGDGE